MKGTMKAGQLVSVGRLGVTEVPIPEVGQGEVLVHVLRAGLNRGDLHMLTGDFQLDPGVESNELPVLPMTLGHDAFGEVAEVGPGVRDLQVGDLVAAMPTLTCGFCKFCRSEREHLCIHHRVMGFFTLATEWGTPEQDIFSRYKDGFWAEYTRVPASNVIRMRPDDDVDRMALVSQIGVGYRGLKRTRLHPGETVIVAAATGVAGVGAVLSALVMGAATVIAVARDEGRLATLRASNPQRIHTISTRSESITERVREITGGAGAQVLVDLMPFDAQVTVDCLHSLEPGARVALLGGNTELLPIGYRFLMIRSLEFTSSTGRHYADFPELYNLVRVGALDLSAVTPLHFSLEQLEDAYQAIESRAGTRITWPMMKREPRPDLLEARSTRAAVTAGR